MAWVIVWMSLVSQLKYDSLSSRFLGRLLGEWLTLVICLLAAVWWFSGTHWAARANFSLYDELLPMHARAADNRIVLIEIDERSIVQLGRWPWNRHVHAQMLQSLAQQSPRGVLFDVLFTEQSDKKQDDVRLAQSMKALPRLAVPILMQDDLKGNLFSTLPVAPIDSSARLGHIAILPDTDGVVRTVSLQQRDSLNRQWPLLTTLLLDDDFERVSGSGGTFFPTPNAEFNIPYM